MKKKEEEGGMGNEVNKKGLILKEKGIKKKLWK